jgi:hypothetical protein
VTFRAFAHEHSRQVLVDTQLCPLYTRANSSQQKQRTLHPVMTIPLRRAAQQPVRCVTEDLHWIDPSPLERRILLVEQARSPGF